MVNRKSQFIERFEGQGYAVVKAKTFMTNMRNGVSPSKKGLHAEKVLTLSAVTQGAFDPEAWKDGIFDECPPADKRIHTSEFYMCRGNGNKMLVGTAVFSPEDHDDLVFPDTVIAAHIDSNIILLPYLFVAWKMPSVRKQIEENARTTNGTYKINQTVLSNIELIVPPLEKQNEFVSFVEQSDKSKFTVGRRFKSQFIEVFGDPVENEKEWPVFPLSKIASSRLGKMLDKKKQTGLYQRKYLANANVQWFSFDLNDLNQMDFNEDDQQEFSLVNGDLLVCEGGEIGRCAVWREEINDCYFQKAIHRVRCNTEMILPEYLAHSFFYHSQKNGFADIVSSKATIAHLPGDKLKAMGVIVPPIELQQQFVSFVEQSDKSKLSVQNKLSAFRRLTYRILQFEGGLKNVQ